jgi:hypothetical protein
MKVNLFYGYDYHTSDKIAQNFYDWKISCEEEKKDTSCCGGRYTYCMTPTSIGAIVVVKDELTKKEFDLTYYENW